MQINHSEPSIRRGPSAVNQRSFVLLLQLEMTPEPMGEGDAILLKLEPVHVESEGYGAVMHMATLKFIDLRSHAIS